MFSISDLAARYRRDQIATAANADPMVIDYLLDGPPPGVDMSGMTSDRAAARRAIETAIEDASSEVASAVASRYDWAEALETPLVKRLIADRTMFDLHGEVIPEDLEARRRNSLVLLGALRKGSRVLAGADGAPLAERPRVASAAPAPILSGPDGLLERY